MFIYTENKNNLNLFFSRYLQIGKGPCVSLGRTNERKHALDQESKIQEKTITTKKKRKEIENAN